MVIENTLTEGCLKERIIIVLVNQSEEIRTCGMEGEEVFSQILDS